VAEKIKADTLVRFQRSFATIKPEYLAPYLNVAADAATECACR
jgi:hypothetical protein